MLKTTVKRTLALLLVLIFALSNMGLAEMAEQVVAEVPAAEAPVEEVAEESAEESASEELEDGGDEAAPAPAEEEAPADAEAEAPAEDEAPAEAGVEVSVELVATDETTLTAFETITPEGYHDVSYMWEVAESEEGPWTVMDETGGWIVSEAEDRADYVYRCTVTADGVSATSAPGTFDWGVAEEAEAPAQEEHLDVVDFDTLGSGVAIAPTDSTDEFAVFNQNANTDKIVLEATATGSFTGPTTTYSWSLADPEHDRGYVTLSGTNTSKLTITATAAGSNASNMYSGLEIPVYCYVNDNGTEHSGTYNVYVLPPIADKDVETNLTIEDADENPVTELYQGQADVKATLGKLSKGYVATWSTVFAEANPKIASDTICNQWLTVTKNTDGTGKVEPKSSSSNTNPFQVADGQQIPIKATVNIGGETVEAQKVVTIYPAATAATVLVNGAEWEKKEKEYPVGSSIELKVAFSNAAAEAQVPGIKALGSVTALKVKKDSDSEFEPDAKTGALTWSFTPDAKGNYTIDTLTTTPDISSAAPSGNIVVRALPTDLAIGTSTGTTETVKEYYPGDLDKSSEDYQLFLGGDDPYTAGITWSITGNDYGTTGTTSEGQYLEFKGTDKDGNQTVIKKADWPHKGDDKLTLQPINREISTTGTITLTATTLVQAVAGQKAQEKTVTWTIKVLSGTMTGDPQDSDISLSKTTIAQPPVYLDSNKHTVPEFAMAQAIKGSNLANCKVEWKVDNDSTAHDDYWIDIDKDTGAIKALPKLTSGNTNNTFGAATGKQINIQAEVTLKDGTKKTIKTPITIIPVADTLTISSDSVPDDYISDVDTNKIGTTVQVGAGTDSVILTLKASAGSVTPQPIDLYEDYEIKATLTQLASVGGPADDGDPVPLGVNQETGRVSLDLSQAGLYRMDAWIEMADGKIKENAKYITFESKAVSQNVKVTSDPETSVVYPGSQIKFTLSALGEDGTTEEYIGEPTWSLSGTNLTGVVGTDWLASLKNGATSPDAIGLYDTTGQNGKKSVTLNIPASYNKFNDGATLTVTLRIPGSNLETKTFTFDLQQNPSSIINFTTLSGNISLAVPGYVAYDSSMARYGSPNEYYNAQGDSSVVAKLTTDATGTKAIADAKAAGVKLRYSVIAAASGVNVKNFVTIDPDSGAISVLPENKTTEGNNELQGSELTAGKAFKVRYGIEGLDSATSAGDYAVEADFYIVSAPAGVKIVPDDGHGTPVLNGTVPKSTWVGNPLQITAVPVPKTGAITAGKVALANSPAANSFYTFKQETTGGVKDKFYTLTPNKGITNPQDQTVTITASYPGVKDASQEIVITFKNNGLTALDPTAEKCTDGEEHSWTKLLTTQEAKDALKLITDPSVAGKYSEKDGHYFQCTNGTCKAISVPVAHSEFSAKLSDAEVKQGLTQEDALWALSTGRPDTSKAAQGKVTCAICDYACQHEGYPKAGTVQYVDGTHHVAECPVCGLQVKQPHIKTDQGVCSVCGHTAAQPTFSVNPVTILIGDENYKPNLTVADVETYEVEYSYDTGADQYIELVNPQTGEIKARAVTPENTTANLIVTITPMGQKDALPAIGTLKVNVREKVSGITITSDPQGMGDNKAYVIETGSDADTYTVLHLKADVSPSIASADLTGYEWDLDTNASNFEFVVKDPATDAWVKLDPNSPPTVNNEPLSQQEVNKLLAAPEIDVRLVKGKAASITSPAPIYYRKTAATSSSDVAGKIEIEVLPQLEADMLAGWITFNGKKASGSDGKIDNTIKGQDKVSSTATTIIQGQSIPVSIVSKWKQDPNSTSGEGKYVVDKLFDERYGTVKITAEALDAAALTDINGAGAGASKTLEVTAGQRAQWIKIVNADGATASVSAVGASSANALTGAPYTAAFKVTATVTHPWHIAGNKTKSATMTASRYVWVVGDTTTAKFQYEVDGAWADVPETGIDVNEGSDLNIRVYVSTKDEATGAVKPGVNAQSIVWGEVPAVNGTFDADEPHTESPGSGESTTYRTFTVAKTGAPDTFDITASYPGLKITPEKATINVKRLIQTLSLDADITAIGVGETRKTGSVETPVTTVTLTASVTPEDTGDTLTWSVVDKYGNEGIKDVVLKEVKDNKLQMTFEIPEERKDEVSSIGPDVVVKVTAANTKDADGLPLSASKTIMLYKEPEDESAMEIIPAKKFGNGQGGYPNDLFLTVGESTELTAGWAKNSPYGASDSVTFSAIAARNDTPDDAQNDAGKKVVSFSGNVITGDVMGTAEIWIHPVGYNTEVDKIEKKLTVHVTEAANLIKKSTDANFKTSYTITANQPVAKRTSIPKNWLLAYRHKVDPTTQRVTETLAPEAEVVLKSDDETILKVVESEDGENWELLGVEPGTANIYGYLNPTTDTKADLLIPVTVQAPVTGIVFKQNGTALPTNTQLRTSMEKPETYTLTVEKVPLNAQGDISVAVDKPAVVDMKQTGTNSLTLTLTPLAAGTAVVTAQVANPNWVTGTDTPQNPQYLTARVEILVTETDEGGGTVTPGGEIGTKIVGKAAIGPKESTQVAATGVSSVTWTVDPVAAVATEVHSDDNSIQITSNGTTDGKVTVTATSNGTVIGSQTIYLLTAIEEVALTRGDSLIMSVGEMLPLEAEIVSGYDFQPSVKAEAEAAGVVKDYSNLFTFTSNLPAKLAVVGENEKFNVKALGKPGKKDVAPILTVHGGTKTKDVPVTINAKTKSFNIGDVNGSTLYMAPGQKKTITITSKPKSSPANLIYVISDEDGEVYVDEVPGVLSITKTTTTGVIEIASGAAPGVYSVTVKTEGYTNHADQNFTIVVEEDVSEGAQVAVIKAGLPRGEGNKPLFGTVNVVKGEKLQTVIVDASGNIVGGDVTFAAQSKAEKKIAPITSTGVISTKKAGSIQIAPTVKSADGTTVTVTPLSLNIVAVPKGKIALDPTEKTRTVAVGEAFKLALTGVTYPGTKPEDSEAAWYTISATADLDLVDESDEENPNTYHFDKVGTTKLTLKPIWGGKAQSVKFTVVEPMATSFDVPDEVKVAANTKTIVKADMDGYANLSWKANGVEIGTKDVAVVADKSIKAKKLDNSTIQITATKKAAGEATLTVTGLGETQEMKITVAPAAATAFPEGTTMVFDKKVITVGEKTNVSLDYNGEEAPAGAITYKFVSVKGAGKASVKNNVITGKAKGVVTIQAQIGGKKGPVVTGKLYVVDKAKIRTAVSPTKMGAGEDLEIDVTIVNYDNNHVLDPGFKDEINTDGLLSVETSSAQISARLEQGEAPNKYLLILHAYDAIKNSRGKFQTTTVTLRLTNGQKKVMKIQVAEPADEAAVFVHRKVTIAPGTSVKLQAAVAQGTSYGANYNWHYASADDEALAEKNGLTLADGKLTAAKKAVPTAADEPIMIEGSYGESDAEIEVVIAAAKAKKNQFKIVTPNRPYAFIGERILGEVEYNPGVGGGDVKWKSSKSKIITVDKTTGLLTVVGPVGKQSVISATANGKASANKVTLTVQQAPDNVAFTKADVILTAGQSQNLTDLLTIDGTSLAGGDYSGAVRFTTDSTDFDLDPGTGVISAKATTTDASAIVRVTTFNGMTADILVVIGQGGGSTGPVGPTDPEDTTPASIELYLNNQAITNQTLEFTEGDAGITPEVKVKNAAGAVIESATVSWASSDETKVSVAATGAITPIAHTLSSTGTAHNPVTITATVAGSTAQASYKVQVKANTSKASNFKFQLMNTTSGANTVMESLLVGDGGSNSTVTSVIGSVVLTIPNTKLETVVDTSSIKVKVLDEKKLKPDTITWGGASHKNQFQVEALAAGEAQITVELTLLDGTKITFPQSIMIDELPGKDSMKIVDKDGVAITSMKLGEEEVGEFHIQMANGFKGMPAGDDLEFYAYELTDTDCTTEIGDGSELKKDSSAIASFASSKDASMHAFAWDAASELTESKKFKIVVTAYEQRYGGASSITPAQKENLPTASFEVEIAPKPATKDYKFTGTFDLQPGVDSEHYTLDLGMGESVSITAAQEAASKSFWSRGLKWVESTTYTNATDEIHATVTPADNAVTVTYNEPEATNVKTIQVVLALVDEKGEAMTTGGTIATVDITFHPLPKKENGVANYSSAIYPYDAEKKQAAGSKITTPLTVGLDESFSVYVRFDPVRPLDITAYTTDVRWVADSEYFEVTPNGAACTFKAKKMTQESTATKPSTVNVEAYYGAGTDLPLGSFQVTIVDKPTASSELVLTNEATNDTFANTISKSSNHDIASALTLQVTFANNKKSATLKLTCATKCVKIEPTGTKNEWEVWYDGSAADASATSATFVLSDQNGLTKYINVTLDS